MRRLLLLPLAASFLLLAACTSSTTSGTASPSASASAHASASPAAPGPVSINLSTASVKVGGTLTVTGSGFSATRSTSVVIVQNGKVLSLVATTVDVKSDGSFTLPVTIPSALAPGPAFINACSFNPKGAADSQCSRHDITLS